MQIIFITIFNRWNKFSFNSFLVSCVRKNLKIHENSQSRYFIDMFHSLFCRQNELTKLTQIFYAKLTDEKSSIFQTFVTCAKKGSNDKFAWSSLKALEFSLLWHFQIKFSEFIVRSIFRPTSMNPAVWRCRFRARK